jgi:hypothetical protein
MANITYLFGAGASCGALPIVKNIPDRLKKLINILVDPSFQLDDSEKFDLRVGSSKSKLNHLKDMVKILKWLLTECFNHSTVDTFAKKLTIIKDYDNLKKLKIALSIFFIFEQAKNSPDQRYDTFFASILDSVHNLPDEIKILTWNYDYQFEISFSNYSNIKKITTNQAMLNIYEKYVQGDLPNPDKFGIFKINGTIGFTTNQRFNRLVYSIEMVESINKEFIEEVTRNYVQAMYNSNIHQSLSFGWEEDRFGSGFFENVQQNIENSVALVVIGYSFPFFNRNIDKIIIKSMTNLKRVYFQDPNPEVLKERFLALTENKYEMRLINDVSQFFLPNEL